MYLKDDKTRFVSGVFKNTVLCKKVVSKECCKESSEVFKACHCLKFFHSATMLQSGPCTLLEEEEVL